QESVYRPLKCRSVISRVIEFASFRGRAVTPKRCLGKDERKLAIGRYPLHAEFFDRLLGGPSLPSVFIAAPPCRGGQLAPADFRVGSIFRAQKLCGIWTKKPSKPAYFLASRRIPAI